MMLYTEFRKIIKQGFSSGEIKTSEPMTELDLAVQYVIGVLGELRGYPLEITPEEIGHAINAYVGDWVYDSENTYGGDNETQM